MYVHIIITPIFPIKTECTYTWVRRMLAFSSRNDLQSARVMKDERIERPDENLVYACKSEFVFVGFFNVRCSRMYPTFMRNLFGSKWGFAPWRPNVSWVDWLGQRVPLWLWLSWVPKIHILVAYVYCTSMIYSYIRESWFGGVRTWTKSLVFACRAFFHVQVISLAKSFYTRSFICGAVYSLYGYFLVVLNSMKTREIW